MKNNTDLEALLNTYSDMVVISPHLDDAVFSAGGLLTYLAQKNVPVRVYSVFTTGGAMENENTRKLVGWGGYGSTADYFAARKAEDLEAFAEIGQVKVENLDFIDAAWRARDTGEAIYIENVIGVIDEADRPLIQTVADRLKTLPIDTNKTAIFSPLAVGRHVDHFLTREACTLAFPVSHYYADFPYTEKFPMEDEFVKEHNLTEVQWRIDDPRLKERAMRTYKSQIKALFGKYKMELGSEIYFAHLNDR